ncbi:MCE family protein [Actinokineospora bangkokensis]|uniref:ABC transporter substrate-binding protein n=1 Tax=Actinokineospora bangkokensis TaxID=1193682 RepID=A0A1Q9LJ84_9PSEU|nr:MCE family protein [Actinokineospora bangkokensis]OLR92098.1 ABC transporter substrate-binding protein [Actinokineospora bangkokensis]
MSTRLRKQTMGLVFIVIIGLLMWLAIAIYDKQFVSSTRVTLQADRVGNQLKENADVKVRGVVVGTVRGVDTDGDGVSVTLALDPDKLRMLPSNVTARLLPKTLFGQRYVALQLPEDADRPLREGDTIKQDTSVESVELEKALRDLLPVLQAVQPQKLNSTLGALSQALEGRGKSLGETLVLLNSYLDQLNPKMPEIQNDITKFADTLGVYEKAAPDIIDALDGLTTTTKTIAEQKDQVAALFSSLTTASDNLANFVGGNRKTIIDLSENSRPTLELLARYSPEYPCLAQAVVNLKPRVEKALGVGTNEPGMHVNLVVKESRGAYVPGRDRPTFGAGGGPRCYTGGLAGGATPAVATDQGQTTAGTDGTGSADLGEVNSVAESQFINHLIAPTTDDLTAADLPDWSSVLVGPILRGAEVNLS